ncbi:tellurite resistance TerB family protein [Prochlorococcus sp. MIT 1300]|uniref:tellurite resistance TerB family protein n=1 Tax=Prochlorococcus sp. MIT 1300 TaxID=3096218 RepID=UPI002A757B55|nr:tellurite resistance TerB family protein [Prochlorococcus sp. MIT 1300]
MDTPSKQIEAFVTVLLAAVASDGVLTPGEAHSLREQLELRHPFSEMTKLEMAALFDSILSRLRSTATEVLVAEAITRLSFDQQESVLAVSAHLLHADGVVSPPEEEFLEHLITQVSLPREHANMILLSIVALNRDTLSR